MSQTLLLAYCIGHFNAFEDVSMCLSRLGVLGLLLSKNTYRVSSLLKIKRPLIRENSSVTK